MDSEAAAKQRSTRAVGAIVQGEDRGERWCGLCKCGSYLQEVSESMFTREQREIVYACMSVCSEDRCLWDVKMCESSV